MIQALRCAFPALICFFASYGTSQVPLLTFPDLTSITFYEQTGGITPHTFGVNDAALTTQASGPLNSGNSDFQGVFNAEFYDAYFSDADGTFNSNGGFISIECRYDINDGGGALNINEVEFHFGSGYSMYGKYLTSYVSNGITYLSGSEEWASDCDLSTFAIMGHTENTSIKLRITIGILNPASTIIEDYCSDSGYEVMVGNTTFNEANPIGTEVLTGNDGCDSLVYVDLTFHEAHQQEINYAGCTGDGYSIIVGNAIYNEANPSGTEMLMTQANCDSTILVDLVFSPAYSTEINYYGCEGDGYSVNIDGTVYNEANPDGTEILMSSTGCDSTFTIDLVFAPVNDSEIDYSGCSGDNYAVVVNGTIYNESNPAGQEILINQSGCDSIVNIELTFGSSYVNNVIYSSCSGSGYAIVINGNTYDEGNPSGIEFMTSVGGCDSLILIDLTFVQTMSQVMSYSGCTGDGYSILVNGTIYDEGNPTGLETLTTMNGCDSIIIVSLSFLPAFTTNEFYSTCIGSGFSVIVNGNVYDENNPSGVEVLTSQSGCDSIVNIQLDFLANAMGTETYAGCLGDGYSVTVNGTTYDELNPSGTEILTSQNGCDSIIMVNLIFENIVSTMHSYTGCEGDGYEVVINGNLYNEANPNGIEILQGAMGCDTFVTIALVFNPARSSAINYLGCVGDGYEVNVNGTLYNETNPQGTEILTAQKGCDSIVTLALNFLAHTQYAVEYSGCLGDNYSILVNGTLYNETNPTGTEILTGSNGCDSIISVNLVFGNQFMTTENYSGCAGDGYFIIVNGNLYDEQNPIGSEDIPGVAGCDTIIDIELLFAPASLTNITYEGCAGDGYGIFVNGTAYDEHHPNGVETMTTVHGCDSIISVALSFVSADTTDISYSGCIGDGYSVTVDGSSYNELNTSGFEVMQTSEGCDSIIHIDLLYEDCDEQEVECAIYIPNVISPNDDGINDAFSFGYATTCEITSCRIALFDRWGNVLYASTDPHFKWKGDFKDQQLQPGVFVYIAEMLFAGNPTPVIRRGDLTLIR